MHDKNDGIPYRYRSGDFIVKASMKCSMTLNHHSVLVQYFNDVLVLDTAISVSSSRDVGNPYIVYGISVNKLIYREQ